MGAHPTRWRKASAAAWCTFEASAKAIVSAMGAFYRVILADGELKTDQVVVALPSRIAATVLSPCDDLLSRELGGIEYVSTATVCFAYQRSQISHPLDAVGFLVPRNEGRRITGGTFISSKWAGRAAPEFALLRAFVGGAHDEATPLLEEAELVALVRGELEGLLGIQGAPRFAKCFISQGEPSTPGRAR
jgi:oxygen-dependent protoporphyrinogen oxidase